MTQTLQAQYATSRDGTPIAYWTSGTGPPVVLVHGGTADHTRWQSVLPLLDPHVTAHVIDRRGRGGSGDTEPYSVEREGEDIAAVVDDVAAATGAPVVLLGHSFGGICSLEAVLRTTALAGLVLYEPPLGAEAQVKAGMRDRLAGLLAEGRRDEMLQVFFREEVELPEDQLQLIRSLPAWQGRVAAAHTLVREISVVESYRLRPERFASLGAATLLLTGGDSPRWATEGAAALAEAISGASIEVMAGQQHVAMDTAPEAFTQLVVDFVTQVRS